MNINDVTKFVINLDRRVDRLNSIQEEMGYIGWDFERFSAVDTNSHRGCSLSHIEIIKIAKSHNLKEVLVIEDDCTFMPYSKSLIQTIVEETNNLDFGIFNLAPTLNRPVNLSQDYTSLLDITNLPPAESHHRGIFATNMIMYNESVYDEVLALEESSKLN
jgi:glycosyl transferase family 25